MIAKCIDCGAPLQPGALHWCDKQKMFSVTYDLLRIQAVREWWFELKKKFRK